MSSDSEYSSDETEIASSSSSGTNDNQVNREQQPVYEIQHPTLQQNLIQVQQLDQPQIQQVWDNNNNEYLQHNLQQPIILDLDNINQEQLIRVEWEVHSIVGHYVSAGNIYYRLRWSPPGEWEDTWEPSVNCQCDNLIRAYVEQHLFFQQ